MTCSHTRPPFHKKSIITFRIAKGQRTVLFPFSQKNQHNTIWKQAIQAVLPIPFPKAVLLTKSMPCIFPYPLPSLLKCYFRRPNFFRLWKKACHSMLCTLYFRVFLVVITVHKLYQTIRVFSRIHSTSVLTQLLHLPLLFQLGHSLFYVESL